MDNSTIIAIAISAFIIISGALLWYLNRERQRVFKKYGKPTLEIDFGRTFFYNNLELAIINGQEFKYSEIENYEVYKHSEVVDGEVKLHIPADTRSAFPVISVQSPVSIQYRWQS